MFTITALYRISQYRTRSLAMFAGTEASIATTIAMAKARASEDEILESITIQAAVLETG